MFLPVNAAEVKDRGWDEVDFVYVTGDAYVDHPSFGASIITRVLEAEGYRVAVLAQPEWKTTDDFKRFGRPKLGFLVTSGNIDSMVAHYTAAKKKRSQDAYSPGRMTGLRPDRAVIVYCNKIREAYGDIPIIIGGLEASLRRFAHYDYWDDKIRRSVLLDSQADLLIYGMGENQIIEVCRRISNGESIDSICDVRGTCYLCGVEETPYEGKECPSFENCVKSKKEYAVSCRIEQDEQDHIRGKAVKQRHGSKMLVQNPPMAPLTQQELDWVYSLPYERTYHPMYENMGGVPAIEEVRFSITHNRGCFGACNFCSLAFHQGRFITTRSKESIVKEAKLLTTLPDFKGYIHDIGGPTANFRRTSCLKQLEYGLCKGKKCLAPTPCKALEADHSEFLDILRTVRELPKVKKVFIRSGIRYDYMLADKDDTFFREMVKYHVSGQLRVAPEHLSDRVLHYMGKPTFKQYDRFVQKFNRACDKYHLKQYIVPYFISSHPGSTLQDAVMLAEYLRDHHLEPEQVQDFYPTPGSRATAMYYTGLDLETLKPIHIPKGHEKRLQRALLQYRNPKNRSLVIEALKKCGREDLIGPGRKCLVHPQHQRPIRNKRSRRNRKGGK